MKNSQTENKWLTQINENQKLDQPEELDEYLQAVIGPMIRIGAQVAKVAVQALARTARAGAKGAKAVGKGVAKTAKKVGKKVAKKVTDKVKDKAIDLAKEKAQKEIDKKMNGAEKSVEEQLVHEFRMEFRRKLIREILSEAPAGPPEGDSSKAGMDPEAAKEIMKSLEGKTVKAKSGKEIKVSSALNPTYKKTDPRAHKKATDMFKKSAQDFYSKNSRKKQGGKVPKSAADLKNKKKTNTPTKAPTDKNKKKSPQAEPAKRGRPRTKKYEKATKPKSMAKQPSEMTPAQLKSENKFTRRQQSEADKKYNAQVALAKANPRDVGMAVAVQKAADDKFKATSLRAKSAKRTLDHYDVQKQSVKDKYPNPLSSKRRKLLKQIRTEKAAAYKETGYDTATHIKDLNQDRLKDKYTTLFDPTNSETGSTQFSHGDKKFEMSGTRAHPETGELLVVGYEMNEDGEQIKNDDGTPKEYTMPAKAFEKEATDLNADEKDKKTDDDEEGFFSGMIKGMFDFSDPIDIANALDLETGSSSYVAA